MENDNKITEEVEVIDKDRVIIWVTNENKNGNKTKHGIFAISEKLFDSLIPKDKNESVEIE